MAHVKNSPELWLALDELDANSSFRIFAFLHLLALFSSIVGSFSDRLSPAVGKMAMRHTTSHEVSNLHLRDRL